MIVITGGTGFVGRRLAHALTVRAAEVRVVTRRLTTAEPPPPGVNAVEGDPTRPETMIPALTGATALFVNPRATGAGTAELLGVAAEQGVRRVVALSANNVDDDPARQPSRANGDRNREVEQAVVASGLEWVSLRCAELAVNTARMWAGQIQRADVVRGPYAESTWTPLDERDIA